MPRTTQNGPVTRLRSSQKFMKWRPSLFLTPQIVVADVESGVVAERHYTPAQLAEMWGVSVQTIRDVFKHEPGVLKLGSNGTRTRRGYKTLRIPHSVAERVHTRLSA